MFEEISRIVEALRDNHITQAEANEWLNELIVLFGEQVVLNANY